MGVPTQQVAARARVDGEAINTQFANDRRQLKATTLRTPFTRSLSCAYGHTALRCSASGRRSEI